jgi:hypothetical protein
MLAGLAVSIPFSALRFIRYVPPVAAHGASYKDNPGWQEAARQNERHRQTFCGILGLVAAPSRNFAMPRRVVLRGGKRLSKSRGLRWRLRDDSTMVLFGLAQPH